MRRHGRGREPSPAPISRTAVMTPRAWPLPSSRRRRGRHPRRKHGRALLTHRDGRVARGLPARDGTAADDRHPFRVLDVESSRHRRRGGADRRRFGELAAVAAPARRAKAAFARGTRARAELARVVRSRTRRDRDPALKRCPVPLRRRGPFEGLAREEAHVRALLGDDFVPE